MLTTASVIPLLRERGISARYCSSSGLNNLPYSRASSSAEQHLPLEDVFACEIHSEKVAKLSAAPIERHTASEN